MEVTRMTTAELDDLAKNVVTNVVYITNSDEGVRNSFGMLLGLVGGDMLPEAEAEKVGAIWEEWSKAGPRALNGYPIFFSGHFVHRDDLELLVAAIEAKEKALDTTTEVS